MDRMLHRGEYEKITDAVGETRAKNVDFAKKGIFARIMNFNEHFSRSDKWITGGLFGWSMLWFSTFVIGSLWNLVAPWPNEVWKTFWHITGVGIPVFMSLVTAIWFTWGGTRDIFALFRRLREAKVNELDDGTVVGHQNLDEVMLSEKAENPKAG